MRMRFNTLSVVVLTSFAIAAFAASAVRGDYSFTDNFDRTSLGDNYTAVGTASGSIVDGKLHIASGTTWDTINTVPANVGGFGSAGSFVSSNIYVSSDLPAATLTFDTTANPGLLYRMQNHGVVSYKKSGGWVDLPGGTVTTGQTHEFTVVNVGGTTPTTHVFVDKIHYGTGASADIGASDGAIKMMSKQNDSLGYTEFDNLVAFKNSNNSTGATTAIKNGLNKVYSQDFTGLSELPTGFTATLGTGVSLGVSDGKINLGETADYSGADVTVDFTNTALAGRALKAGEYVEFSLARTTSKGNIGCVTFGPAIGHDMASTAYGEVGTGLKQSCVSADGVWLKSAQMTPSSVSFDFNAENTLGIKVDYINSTEQYAVLSYYMNGDYATSWLYDTSGDGISGLTDIHLKCWGKSGSEFTFDNVAVYTVVPEPATVTLLGTALLGLLAYAWRRRR